MTPRQEPLRRKLVRAISRGSMSSFKLADVTKAEKHGYKLTWSVLGVDRTLTDDFQHMCLELDWLPLISLVFVVYSAVSLLFAGAFYGLMRLDAAHFVGERLDLGLFEECIWLSVGHLVTIGYGGLLPASRGAFMLATLEHFVGIFMSAVLLGVVVNKASIPSAKVIFSQNVTFTSRNGDPVVVFRVGNTRGNFLLNPDVRARYFHRMHTIEGERTYAGIRLEVEEPPVLAPCFNLVHRVTESSPFYGMTEEQVLAQDGSLTVSLSATDDHSLQTLFARKLFTKDNFLFGMRFGDVLMSKGTARIVDFRRFDDVVPVASVTEWVGRKTHPRASANDENDDEQDERKGEEEEDPGARS